MLKFMILKSCQTFHYIYKTYSNLISNPRGSLALEAQTSLKKTKIFKKMNKFYQKINKICDIKKLENYSMANKNLSVS